jgi:hypothetical protein
MRRVKIFAKGNVDVHDTLHSSHVGGKRQWNGVNEVVRTTHSGTLIRLTHETASRSEALLMADGHIPVELAGVDRLLGPHTVRSQFSTRLFDTDADAIILSILPDVAAGLHRHRGRGFLFHAPDSDRWPSEDRRWLARDFIAVDPQTVESAMETFEKIIERIRASTGAPILVFNLSSVITGDNTHCFAGLGESLVVRVRRFNLGLIDLSARTGVSIVDVDSLIARGGADQMKLDTFHLAPAGLRRLAEAVVYILDDLGVL